MEGTFFGLKARRLLTLARTPASPVLQSVPYFCSVTGPLSNSKIHTVRALDHSNCGTALSAGVKSALTEALEMKSETGSRAAWTTVSLGLLLAICLSSTLGQQAAPSQTRKIIITVTDSDQKVVTDLKAEDFKLYVDGQPQQVSSVTASDASTCLGLVVDTSGSMRGKHGDVKKALLNLVSAANAQGQTFVVNFNDDGYLDQDFTTDLNLVKRGLERGDPRGGTALYDAIFAAASHEAKAPQCQQRILVVLTDGQDNDSRMGLEQLIREVQMSNTPVIYAIVLPDEHSSTRARRAMEAITKQIGGKAFFSGNLNKDVRDVTDAIRGQYIINYIAEDRHDGAYHVVKVVAQSAHHSALTVSGQAGYYSPASKTTPASAAASTEKPRPPVSSSVQESDPIVHLPIGKKSPTDLNCIMGTVVDENNLPVQGITVRATPDGPDLQPGDRSASKSLFSRTGPNGTFRLFGIPPGSYRLSTFNLRAGYAPTAIPLYGSGKTQTVSLTAGAPGCSDVVLNAGAKAARLKLNVVESGTEKRITGFSVILRREDIPSSNITIRDDAGYDLLVPPLADLTIQVKAEGYDMSEPVRLKSAASDVSQELTAELRPALLRP